MTAYTRNDDGTLRRTVLAWLGDGLAALGGSYGTVRLHPAGTERLLGWGVDDGEAAVYAIDQTGREVLLPYRHRAGEREVVA